MKVELLNSQLVFDFNDDTNDDNVMVFPCLILLASPIKCNVRTILRSLTQDGPRQPRVLYPRHQPTLSSFTFFVYKCKMFSHRCAI